MYILLIPLDLNTTVYAKGVLMFPRLGFRIMDSTTGHSCIFLLSFHFQPPFHPCFNPNSPLSHRYSLMHNIPTDATLRAMLTTVSTNKCLLTS